MSDIQNLSDQYHFNVYRRLPIVLSKGKGTRVWDNQGKKYIDFLAGISVNALGHNHPAIVRAIHDQARNLIHVSNIYYNEPQTKLAELLCKTSGFEKVFFCNSGLEANEAAIKLARRFGYINNKKGEIISFTNCFHGRSIACLSMGEGKYKKNFGPFPDGFKRLVYNDIPGIQSSINDDTIAVFVESVQGEGGIIPAKTEFMQELKLLSEQHKVLLICDEIQSGLGRTGKLFGYEHFNIRPDVITIAKSLGGGLPIGAVLTSKNIAELFDLGDHGSTFGGNPLACATAFATLTVILDSDLINSAHKSGEYLLKELKSRISNLPGVIDIRGLGLMVGIEMEYPCRPIVEKMLDHGFLINCTAEKTLRLLPPLIITKKEIDSMIRALKNCIKSMK